HYQRITIPYQGFLDQVGFYYDQVVKGVKNPATVIFKFRNDYFMPPNVTEREYSSVIYGYPTDMARYYPDLMTVQPDTTLYFYLILIGDIRPESIRLTSPKLNQLFRQFNKNTFNNIAPVWFRKGEDIGSFSC